MPKQRIAVFRGLFLGDLLCAVPALRALRASFPQAEITLIGLPWAASFVARFDRYLDRFVEFAGYPGINEVPVDPARTAAFLDEQRAYGYDIAVQMHGSGGTSNPFVLDLRARATVAYYVGEPPAGLTLGAPYPDDEPEIKRNLGLVRLLGCPSRGLHSEFPLFQRDLAEADRLLRPLGFKDRPWIGLHAGSRQPTRRWPPAYFARVADHFARAHDARVILTGVPEEAPIVQAVAQRMKTKPLVLAGKTSLGGLAAIIERLDLFISNDTGPSHMARAIDTPSVTVFGPVDHTRWAALNPERHRLVRQPVDCSPCPHWECPIDHRCMRWVTPEMVVEVGEALLVNEFVKEKVWSA